MKTIITNEFTGYCPNTGIYTPPAPVVNSDAERDMLAHKLACNSTQTVGELKTLPVHVLRQLVDVVIANRYTKAA